MVRIYYAFISIEMYSNHKKVLKGTRYGEV